MKYSFFSVLAFVTVLYMPALITAVPLAHRDFFARNHVSTNSTISVVPSSTTSQTKTRESTTTVSTNTTTVTKSKVTATGTKAKSTASTTIIKGSSPLETALIPKITDWNSCQGFLSSSGINLFVNQVDLNFDVVVNEVTVFEILIDNNGQARETRVRHAFPQPTKYYPEFDRNKGKGKGTTARISKTSTRAKSTPSSTTTTTAKETKSISTSAKTTTSSGVKTTTTSMTTQSTTTPSSTTTSAV